MPVTEHLIARFLHVTLAMLWVGNLGHLSMVLLPAARGRDHAPNLGPIVQRLRTTLYLGPATFLAGALTATILGVVVALLMVSALLGGFV